VVLLNVRARNVAGDGDVKSKAISDDFVMVVSGVKNEACALDWSAWCSTAFVPECVSARRSRVSSMGSQSTRAAAGAGDNKAGTML
jgi:hypothetical protein